MSEEDLQTAEGKKKKKDKGNGQRERYTQLNAEFQRIARRDKKVFLNKQCNEIEENNRMGKTRDLFKKMRDTKGIFDAKMGSIGQKWYGPNRNKTVTINWPAWDVDRMWGGPFMGIQRELFGK